MRAPTLCARKLAIRFGGLQALADFDLAVGEGELVGLIGPNGAGKTTAFNCLTGIYRPTAGAVELEGRRVDGRAPHRIAAAGLARTFQNIRLFRELSVLDNVRIACHAGSRASWLQSIARTPAARREERAVVDRADRLLDRLALGHRRDELAKNLPYGEQRRLEIARALATSPKVLLLDEPAAGMNSGEKVELMELIGRLRDEFSLGILLIEHDMRLVMGICERLVVLDHGVTIAAGAPDAVRRDGRVIEAYLGIPAADDPRDAARAAGQEGR